MKKGYKETMFVTPEAWTWWKSLDRFTSLGIALKAIVLSPILLLLFCIEIGIQCQYELTDEEKEKYDS